MSAVRPISAAIAFLFASIAPVDGQTVFNAVTQGPNGPTNSLFQIQGGTITPINTGLSTNDFPSLSRDGRFITISAPDPARPQQTSTDLFIYDRATGTRRTLVDYTTEPLQSGAFATSTPKFSSLSPNNQLVVLSTQILITTNLQGTSSTPILTVHRVSDGFQLSLPEFGQGNAIDFFRGEFVGITWRPDGLAFATPAYVNVLSERGFQGSTVGIVVYGFNSTTLQWERSGQLTSPRIFDSTIPARIETHIFPSFSPDGQRLAYFEVTWPDALLQSPATARLIVMNTNGTGATSLLQFNPGFYPLGSAWTPDGSQIIFSIAQQVQQSGLFSPLGIPETAVVRTIDSVNGGTPSPIAGLSSGFFASIPLVTSGGGGGVLPEEQKLPVEFKTQVDGSFTLTGFELDPESIYKLESSSDLATFGNAVEMTGQDFMNGIPLPSTQSSIFYRFVIVEQ